MKNFRVLCPLLFSLLVFAFPILAEKNPSKGQCIKDANNAYKEALKEAVDERKLAKLICNAKTPEQAACIQSCYQARRDCLKPLNDAFKSCYEVADTAFAAGRSSCKTSSGCVADCPGDQKFQECMIPVRIALFNARKACRDADKDRKAARKACREAYRTCEKAC